MSILTLLKKEARPMKPAEIAKALRKTPAGVRSRLCRLAKEGAVVRLPEGYMLADAAGEDPALSWLDSDAPRQRPDNEHICDRGLSGNGGRRCLDNGLDNVLGNKEGNEEVTEEGNVYDPEEAFSEGYQDVFGEPPDTALVRREVRRFLAEKGLLFDAEQVDRGTANFLYLRGQRVGEVELGKKLEEEKAVPNVRERIHRFCQDAQAYLENRPRPEGNPYLLEVVKPVQAKLDVMAAERIAQVLDPPENPATTALAALCKITLTQMASVIEANNKIIKKFLDPDPEPASPLVAFADMLLRQKLAEFLAREIADMLPAGEENREKAPALEYLPEQGPAQVEEPGRLLSALLDQAGERLRGSLWPWGNPSCGGL